MRTVVAGDGRAVWRRCGGPAEHCTLHVPAGQGGGHSPATPLLNLLTTLAKLPISYFFCKIENNYGTEKEDKTPGQLHRSTPSVLGNSYKIVVVFS